MKRFKKASAYALSALLAVQLFGAAEPFLRQSPKKYRFQRLALKR